MFAKLLVVATAALLFSVANVHASPVVFNDPVIFNSDITSTQKSEINDPRFVFVNVDYTVNDDGGAMALPDFPVGYAIFPLNGVDQYFPYYNAPINAKAEAKSSSCVTAKAEAVDTVDRGVQPDTGVYPEQKAMVQV